MVRRSSIEDPVQQKHHISLKGIESTTVELTVVLNASTTILLIRQWGTLVSVFSHVGERFATFREQVHRPPDSNISVPRNKQHVSHKIWFMATVSNDSYRFQCLYRVQVIAWIEQRRLNQLKNQLIKVVSQLGIIMLLKENSSIYYTV